MGSLRWCISYLKQIVVGDEGFWIYWVIIVFRASCHCIFFCCNFIHTFFIGEGRLLGCCLSCMYSSSWQYFSLIQFSLIHDYFPGSLIVKESVLSSLSWVQTMLFLLSQVFTPSLLLPHLSSTRASTCHRLFPVAQAHYKKRLQNTFRTFIPLV